MLFVGVSAKNCVEAVRAGLDPLGNVGCPVGDPADVAFAEAAEN
jgi:hypothetical protein